MSLEVFTDIETIPPDEALKSKLNIDVLRRILRNTDLNTAVKRKVSNNEAVVLRDNDLSGSENTALKMKDKENECSNGCTEEMFRRLALHAEYGRILCIGVILERNGVEVRRGVFGIDKGSEVFHLDEKKTLRGFWKLLKEEFNPKTDLIIGHNVLEFDLPFIYKRSRIKQIKPSFNLSFARYRNAPIFDTMKEWSLWNVRETLLSLSHLAELLEVGLEKTDGMDGGKVYDEFLAGNHKLIADYCLRDVEMTRAIYRRVTLHESLKTT